MPNVFTTYAVSRFVDAAAVVNALRGCAERLRATHPGIAAVWLFGSYAAGRATPRSDADIVVEITGEEGIDLERIRSLAMDAFGDSPVPVDLFVLSTARLVGGRGIAGEIKRSGVRLA